MTGSGPKLGVLLLVAVLLQTVVVTITVLHFTSALNSMKETFARSSVSCLTGSDLQSITAVRGDPCWQVTQQLHLLIEKVSQMLQPNNKTNLQTSGKTVTLQLLAAQTELHISVC
ncbi:hypothetical protein ATANTOWER_025848 [Ataeniobius toweri]|uniref:Uncharacterized protein n=1 Tax=Ataeniobius toweri TaxID=208326 RepID=A0ABU7A3B1_9TELE|nr:hypothetical protein [Ataeniobius toweri]